MKRVLVIGTNGTIGSAITANLKDKGYLVEALSQQQGNYSESNLENVYQQLKLGEPFSMIFCCIGTLHNDIVAPEKCLAQLEAQKLAEYFRVNTILPSLCMRFFYRLLDKKSPSKFIFLSAMVGSVEDNKLGGWYGYRSSKAALNMMVKTGSIEVKRSNKKACLATIHPGTTRGPLSKPFSAGVADDKYYAPEQSAERIIDLTEKLTAEQTGSFFNWDGTPLPW